MSDHDLAINKLAAGGVPNRAQELAQLFPEALTDGKVDVEKLKLLLSEAVEESQERYGLSWPGKRNAIRLAQKQSTATLAPMADESVDWDTTKNLIIEGDNLEVLKLLQKSYYGQVKLIYIDPPYNTGKDFVYEDDFSEPTESYLKRSRQVDDGGFATSTNRETSGRFHSNWLNMMHARFMISRRLLTEDGVILVSINDVEVARVRMLLEEVFGEDNFLAQFVWVNEGNVDQQSKIKGIHEYIIAFSRSKSNFNNPSIIDPNIEESSKLFNSKIENSITKNGPANPPSRIDLPVGFPADFESGVIPPRMDKWPHVIDSIEIGGGTLTKPASVFSGWSSKRQLELFIANGLNPIVDSSGRQTSFHLTRTGAIYMTKERSGDQGHVVSVLRNMGTTKQASGQLASWDIDFSYPKPVYLIQYLLEIFIGDLKEAVVCDFFAGSGTTGEAVLRLNESKSKSISYLLVQIPEVTESGQSLSSLTRRRMVEAGRELSLKAKSSKRNFDGGFRAFRLGESNFKNWDADADALLAEDLEAFVNNINTNASDEGIVHEILLKAGIRQDTDLSTVNVAGVDVTLAFDGLFAVSANRTISQEFIDGLLALEPHVQQVYLLDSGFGDNDSLKVNARHQFAARRSDSDPDKDDALRTV